jgi:opacity protein-like surface antigen
VLVALGIAAAGALAASGAPAAAQAQGAGHGGGVWSLTLYGQESFPKQTNTNDQIAEINRTFGTHFEDWDDTHNLSLQLFRRVSPRWQLGLEVDGSRGSIGGTETVLTEAGPAELEFEQKYDLYADLLGVAHFLPCPSCRRVTPFVLLGAGVAYEKDTTTLTLRNEYLDSELTADSDGTFPVYTAGLGLDVPVPAGGPWYLEVGTAYFWGRFEHRVPARGDLAPAPEVLADTDSTGPNYWIGIGRRF